MAVKGRVAVSGASGFVGSRVVEALERAGYAVAPIVRRRGRNPDAIFYDYEKRRIELEKLAQCFAVIHLGGRNLMDGIWTSTFKQELYDSRVKSTRFLAHSLAKIDGPQILLNASAIGIYGDRADLKLDETSRAGTGFLAKMCIDWERGTRFATEAGVRVVNMRFGIVLDKDGGMLKKMVPLFKRGLGAIVGDGQQHLSFVSRDELAKIIIYLLEDYSIHGPVNCVAHEPTTQEEFARAVAHAYGREVKMRVPEWLLKPLGEQMAMVLASSRVYPKVLMDHHYPFEIHRSIDETVSELVRSSTKA